MATRLGFVTWTMVNCTMKIILIGVCLKTLAKNFHHVSIICLLVSDVCLSTTTSTYSIVRDMTNMKTCIVLLNLIPYFLLLNYCFLLLICVHRFVTLKTTSFNAVKQKFENCKYRIISGTIFIPFLYQLGDSLLTPIANKEFGVCNVPDVYGPYQSLFIAYWLVPLSIFMVTIVCLYGKGSHIVWKRFMRVKPLDAKIVFQNTSVRQSIEQAGSCSEMNSTRQIDNDGDSNGLGIDDITVTIENVSSSSCKNVTSHDEFQCGSRSTFDLFKRDDDVISEVVTPMSEREGADGHRQNELRLSCDMLPRDNPIICRPVIINQRKTDRSWEIRAFFTCLLIALQTILLTGPIIVGFWMDVLTGKHTSTEIKFILAFPYLLQGFLNLFIYTWRFNEVRQAFRKFCRRQP